jgi:hypothetical protein
MYAEMAKELLQKDGIPSMIKGGGGGTGPVVFQNSGGKWPVVGMGVDVYVNEEDLDRAKDLLEAIYDGN